MRYAVISDIHSNLEALTSFFEAAENLDIDKTVCLGDIVGYNANPNECIALVRERGVQCLLGNHDSRVVGFEEPTDFNFHAAAAVYWTRDAISEENKEFLKGLPRNILVNSKFLAVHGWVNDTDRYIMGQRDAERNFGLMNEKKATLGLCFFGHTHVPAAYAMTGEDMSVVGATNPFKLEKGVKYLVNPGSVGQPRDRDPRASFLVFDSKKKQITFHRVDYDIHTTSEKILVAGLPERLAERLKLGW
ncbi:MAG TPA: metallophosphoesterase family protein [Syntrophales bacterium]|nr:MAG: hypothetical protein A2052_08970 [Deltaproteobacteria bacterium GWA2_54_12]HLA04391.1 metallophosphoesterase family protein [Syntrophales bacterium]